MMGKTHITMGIATTLFLSQPDTPRAFCLAVLGGSIGGVLADVDVIKTDNTGDAISAQKITGIISVVILVIDFIFNLGILDSILSNESSVLIVGIGLFIFLWLKGYKSNHRTFTHSFTAMILFTFCVIMIAPILAGYFILGYLSHIGLDILNKRKLRLFYPLKFGYCLNKYYANKKENRRFMIGGLVFSVLYAPTKYILYVLSQQ